MFFTHATAVYDVRTTIEAGEAHASEYDVDGIVDKIYEMRGNYDVQAVPPSIFWLVVDTYYSAW
jgi:hypothetical protein